MIEVKIAGLAELKSTLAALPAAMQARALRGMVQTAAAVIKAEAIARAPVYTGKVQAGHPPPGALKAAIYQVRVGQACTPTREVAKVDVRKGLRYQAHQTKGQVVNIDAYYATWVEYGTVKMSARPFMRPAFEVKKQAAVDAMGTYLAFRLADVVQAAKQGGS